MSKHNLHSPPPWVVPVVSNRGHFTVLDDRGEHVVDLTGIRTEDNLPFLLRAVNSHAQLVAALEDAEQWLSRSWTPQEVRNAIEAALATANGAA